MTDHYDHLLHRAADEGITDRLDADLAALCADAVRSGASATLLGVLCDAAAPAPARERALAHAVGIVRAARTDVPAARPTTAAPRHRAAYAALV